MKHDSNSYGLVMACNRAFKSQKLCKINHNVSDTNIRHSALAWTNTYSSYNAQTRISMGEATETVITDLKSYLIGLVHLKS